MFKLRKFAGLLLPVALLLAVAPSARALAPEIVNIVDSDTATLEGSIGHWTPWFSTAVSQSTDQAASGANSLKIDITAPFGWGVQLNNYPGYPVAPGLTTVAFWAAATGTDQDITMTVSWKDAGFNVIQADQLTRTGLTTTFDPVSADLTAPSGTSYVDLTFSSATGGPGDALYVDDIAVMALNSALDDDTGTIEGSTGHWVPWFSTAVSRSTDIALGGTHSMKIDIGASFGWGVQLNNYPGFATTPGPKSVGFWATSPQTGLGITMTVYWKDAVGNVLQTDTVGIDDLTYYFQPGQADLTAPAGTSYVDLQFSNASGVAGNAIYVDDITVINL